MARRNPPIGQDSAVDYGSGVVTLGQEDKYVLPEMEASVRRAADETMSGKRLPIIDPDTGEQIGFTGSKTLKPDWMLDPKGKGKYFEPEETLKVLDGLGRGRWPKTKKQERIAGQIEQALYMDAETEKALAAGGGEEEPPEDEGRGTRDAKKEPEFLSSLEFSRPRVRVDLKDRTFTLGKRSPYKGKIAMVNPSGLCWRVEVYSSGSATPSRVVSRLSKWEAGEFAKQKLAQAKKSGVALRVRITDEPSGKNPLTRRETSDVLRGARQDRRIARSKPVDTPARAYGLGRADLGEMLAYQYGEAKLPAARGRVLRGQVWMTNPRVIGSIPGRMTRIEYQRTGQHPGRYYHNFKPGVSARVLSDGSVLLQGPRRLHVKE